MRIFFDTLLHTTSHILYFTHTSHILYFTLLPTYFTHNSHRLYFTLVHTTSHILHTDSHILHTDFTHTLLPTLLPISSHYFTQTSRILYFLLYFTLVHMTSHRLHTYFTFYFTSH